jgi:hypothetical protein
MKLLLPFMPTLAIIVSVHGRVRPSYAAVEGFALARSERRGYFCDNRYEPSEAVCREGPRVSFAQGSSKDLSSRPLRER